MSEGHGTGEDEAGAAGVSVESENLRVSVRYSGISWSGPGSPLCISP
jgi:hypothetical protein